MGEQFNDGDVEIVRGREDIGCRCAEVRALCRRITMGLRLTEDDEASVDTICGLCQEIFQSLPVLLSVALHIDFDSVTCSQRGPQSSNSRVRRAIKRGSECDGIVDRRQDGRDPQLQSERKRDGEDLDTRLRSLRFKPLVTSSISTKLDKKTKRRTLRTLHPLGLSQRCRSPDLRGKTRSSALSTRG